jgi:hypothetical protein
MLVVLTMRPFLPLESCSQCWCGDDRLDGPSRSHAQLYGTIGLHDYETRDASIVKTIVPDGMPRGRTGAARWITGDSEEDITT